MEILAGLTLLVYIAIIIIPMVIIIYLIIKRIKTKGTEDFEQRDN